MIVRPPNIRAVLSEEGTLTPTCYLEAEDAPLEREGTCVAVDQLDILHCVCGGFVRQIIKQTIHFGGC